MAKYAALFKKVISGGFYIAPNWGDNNVCYKDSDGFYYTNPDMTNPAVDLPANEGGDRITIDGVEKLFQCNRLVDDNGELEEDFFPRLSPFFRLSDPWAAVKLVFSSGKFDQYFYIADGDWRHTPVYLYADGCVKINDKNFRLMHRNARCRFYDLIFDIHWVKRDETSNVHLYFYNCFIKALFELSGHVSWSSDFAYVPLCTNSIVDVISTGVRRAVNFTNITFSVVKRLELLNSGILQIGKGNYLQEPITAPELQINTNSNYNNNHSNLDLSAGTGNINQSTGFNAPVLEDFTANRNSPHIRLVEGQNSAIYKMALPCYNGNANLLELDQLVSEVVEPEKLVDWVKIDDQLMYCEKTISEPYLIDSIKWIGAESQIDSFTRVDQLDSEIPKFIAPSIPTDYSLSTARPCVYIRITIDGIPFKAANDLLGYSIDTNNYFLLELSKGASFIDNDLFLNAEGKIIYTYPMCQSSYQENIDGLERKKLWELMREKVKPNSIIKIEQIVVFMDNTNIDNFQGTSIGIKMNDYSIDSFHDELGDLTNISISDLTVESDLEPIPVPMIVGQSKPFFLGSQRTIKGKLSGKKMEGQSGGYTLVNKDFEIKR